MSEGPGPGVTVLTGGAGGIAAACVRRLGAAAGHYLIADLPSADVTRVAADLEAEGISVEPAFCDVTDPDDVAALFEQAAALGRVVRVVHAAGIAPPRIDDPRKILEVNLLGTCHVLDAFEPLLDAGSVGVCIASLAGRRGFSRQFEHLLAEPTADDFLSRTLVALADLADPALGAYALSKRGVCVQCERRAARWGELGARLLSVSPGLIVDTAMGEVAATTYADTYLEQSALKRAGTADDVANVVAFLCSEAASYLAGTDILLDGGVLSHIDWHAPDSDRDDWHGLKASPGC